MDKSIENELINIVGEDSTKAIGCTEPVAVAYAANVASSYINNDDISKIILKVSKNIYKNGKAVKIPNTGNHGLDLAASLGAFTNESKKPFLVFSNLTDKEIDKARNFTKANNVDVNYIDNVPDIYIEARLITKDNDVTSIISNSHSHVSKIIKNGEVIIDNPFIKDKKSSFSIKNMTFEQLAAIVRNMDINDIDFVLEGIYVNMDAAQEGLKGYGLNLGKKLNELKENNILPDNFITDTRILTAAAADMLGLLHHLKLGMQQLLILQHLLKAS